MTKKELARVEQLLERAALRWTSEVEPDVAIPTGFGNTTGFLFAGDTSDYPRVEPACSSSVHHGFGSAERTDSQHPRRLFSTRLRALQALRHAVEQECARRLRRVDSMIEAIADEQATVPEKKNGVDVAS